MASVGLWGFALRDHPPKRNSSRRSSETPRWNCSFQQRPLKEACKYRGAVGGGIQKARRRERRKGVAKCLCINVTTASINLSAKSITLVQRKEGPKG